jgi:gas vesicle protein
MMDSLKEQHDRLLADKPDGVEHDAATCILCKPDAITNGPKDISTEGGDMKTYTEDDFTQAVEAAVEAAVRPLQTELDAVKASQAQGEVDAQVTAIKAELEQKIGELQSELDKAELRVSEATKERDDIVAYLEAEANAVAEAAKLEEVKSARLEVIKEAASFTDQYIADNLDRWVAMDEDSFASVVEDWKSISTPAPKETATTDLKAPLETALKNESNTTTVSDAALVFGAREHGINIRNLY